MRQYNPRTAAELFASNGWQRSTFCGPNGGNCVEVNVTGDAVVGVRDSKVSDSPVLMFDRQEWTAFVTAVRNGQFDV